MIRPLPKRTYAIAVSASALLLVLCFLIYIEAKNQLNQELESQLHDLGAKVEADFERAVLSNIHSVENLRDRIEESDALFMNYFESDATRIMNQFPAINFIEFIDSDGIIRKVHPISENKAAYLLDIKPITYRYSDWLENSKKRQSNMTAWVNLTQKGKAFLVDVPIFINDEFYGTVSAGMDFKSQFDNLNENLKNIDIQLLDEEENEFYRLNNFTSKDFPTIGEFYSSFRPIPEVGKEWTFKFVLGATALYQEQYIIQKTSLIFGLLISLLIGLLIFYVLRAKYLTKEQIVVNTTLVQLNEDLNEQKQTALEASMHKSEFISNMSHEIRTPLNAILGFVEILSSKKLLRNEQLYLKLMKNSSQNLLGLVNNILDINKIEAGEVVVSNDVFKPSKHLKRIVATYESQIIENKLQLELDVSGNSNSLVVSDSSKFDQIITNILGNAIKFTANGSIKVAYNEYVKNEELIVTYTISDTGFGIPSNKLDSIFKRFVQVENGKKKKYVGGGLGLAITYELIQLLGGTIEVKSEINKGSSFMVQLPMKIAVTPKNKNTVKVKDFSNLKCLIVDDNRINRMVLINFLQKTGIDMDTAGSGEEALEKVRKKTYEIIFMDIHMPDMDGFETTEKVLNINPDSIVIGISADVAVESIKKGRAAGMGDYLTKPIDKDMLFKTLNKIDAIRYSPVEN